MLDFNPRPITTRILLFSFGVFFLEFSTAPGQHISVFDVEYDGLTSSLIQAFFGFIVLEGVVSIFINWRISIINDEYRSVRSDIEGLLKDPNNSEEVSPQPWQESVISKYEKLQYRNRVIYNSYHIIMPIIVGATAILFSIPDICRFVSKLGAVKFSLCA